MSTLTQRKLLLACCASLALGFAACDDGAVNPPPPSNNCGDNVCTENQECVEGKCQDIVQDPCDACTENQECVEGKCQDIVNDPCDACTDTQQCVEGECKDLCGTEICTEEQKCDETTNTCVDKVPIEDPCDKCSESETCVNGECVEVDPCTNKTCPDNFRCDSATGGECVEIDPCENVVCNDGQTCLNAKCIDTACLENGVEKDCGEGKVCSKGECVPSGCANVTCDEGWQCLTLSCDDTGCTGQCVETACINYFCEEGRSCKGGACVDNECLDVTCDADMVCSKGTCTYEACLDKDPCTTGKTCNIEGTCVFIEEPAISLDEPEDKISDEAGKTVALALRLNNQPTQDVRVTCEVWTESPNQEVTTSCDEIVFNADNWELEQTIIVTGIDDFVKDGDQTYKIKVMTLSEDIDFAELSTESVELTNVDKTTPGITVSESALTTYEDQSQEPATFSIVLNSIPNSNVSVSFNSSKTVEGTVSPTSAKFTKDNWNVPQIITVKGTDDNSEDGNKNYTIFFGPSESDDLDYADISLPPIKVTNIDNDVAGISVNLPEAFELPEGQTSTLLLKLNTLPKKDVTISMSADDNTEAMFEETEVTVTPEEWNTGKEIHLTGVADDFIDGDQPVKLTFSATSEDPAYVIEEIIFEGIVKDTDKGDVIASLGNDPIVKEGNADMITMSLMLASKPTSDVTVVLSVSDESELKINKKSLSFKPDHWDLPQDILVTSVDDDIVDGNIKSKIIMNATSGDANFNSKTTELEFTTLDDDEAGFTIKSNAASFPENSGSTSSMSVALKSQPTADVKVTVASSDASELAVTSSNTLTFTAANWKTPQTVNVKVQDDNTADGTQTATIKFTASSTDKNFNGIVGQSALYTIIDNDAASIVLTTANTTLPQAAPNTTGTVVLGSQPTSNVTIDLVASTPQYITFSPSKLTFTTSDWNKPQTVNITGNFGSISTAQANVNIHAKASGDLIYSAVTSNIIALNLIKIPLVQNFAYTGNMQSVSLPSGKYKLEVWGAQGGTQGSGIGGKGGYAAGNIQLDATTTLYIAVGQVGATHSTVTKQHGFNGGGFGCGSGGDGGGATHIATATGQLSTLSGNKSAVLVVGGGGGGGSSWNNTSHGGHGGGASGGNGVSAQYGYGGSQSAGGAGFGSNVGQAGSFGLGGTSQTSNWSDSGGGGAGWFGGGSAGNGPGGGGSGYVNTTRLTNTQLTSGNASIPSPNGGTETGHAGNGYARITIIP